jgi:hypothetical protein
MRLGCLEDFLVDRQLKLFNHVRSQFFKLVFEIQDRLAIIEGLQPRNSNTLNACSRHFMRQVQRQPLVPIC